MHSVKSARWSDLPTDVRSINNERMLRLCCLQRSHLRGRARYRQRLRSPCLRAYSGHEVAEQVKSSQLLAGKRANMNTHHVLREHS
jgi:hypothetical protein